MLNYGIDPLFGDASNGLGFRTLSSLKLPYGKFNGGVASHFGVDPKYFTGSTYEEKGLQFRDRIIRPLFFNDLVEGRAPSTSTSMSPHRRPCARSWPSPRSTPPTGSISCASTAPSSTSWTCPRPSSRTSSAGWTPCPPAAEEDHLMKTLGLDIGTTTISAVVLEDGKLVVARTEKNESFLSLSGASWERLQDPAVIRSTALAMVDALLEDHSDVAAIGVTGQMHGILYLDSQGNPVSPLYTWQDGRGQQPREDGVTWAQWLSETTGYPLATGFGMVTHAYNALNGLAPPEAAVFCTIPDYLAMVLSGRTAPAVDPTNAASLGVYDLRRRDFDREALLQAGVGVGLLPAMEEEPVLGTGPLGRPVTVALGDNQASFLGAAGQPAGTLLVNMGTGGQVSVYSLTIWRRRPWRPVPSPTAAGCWWGPPGRRPQLRPAGAVLPPGGGHGRQ